MVAYAEVVPEALDGLAGEERMRLYEMPRLEVRPNPEGVRGQRKLRTDRMTGTRRFDGTKRTELRFQAQLTEDGT